MLPVSFNAVHSIPGIENEKDIPRNASHIIQCSLLNSNIENEKDIPGNAFCVIQCTSVISRYRK